MTSTKRSPEPYFTLKEDGNDARHIVPDKFPFTIGRARDCDLVIDQQGISRLHAQFDFVHEQIVIVDLGSTNGTFVNRQRISAQEPHRLRTGDVVNLAHVCRLEFDDPSATATIPMVRVPVPGLVMDEEAVVVMVDGRRLDPPLSPGQFALLRMLMARAGAVVTRDEIRAEVWGEGVSVSEQTLDALVSRLRKRLEAADPSHEYIVTRRGFGLIFRNKI